MESLWCQLSVMPLFVKLLLSSLLAATVIISSAAADRLLWTWEPTLQDDTGTGIQVIASDAAGNTCMIVGQVRKEVIPPTIEHGEGMSFQIKQRIIFINKTGSVLLDQEIEGNGVSIEELLGLEPGTDPWRILSVNSKGARIVGRGRSISLSILKPQPVVTTTALEEGEETIALQEVPPFRGYLRKKKEYRFSAGFDLSAPSCHEITKLSLWSLK